MTIIEVAEFLDGYDQILAKRFHKLKPAQRRIAAYGISRHLAAYAKLESEARCDAHALAEILTDAAAGRSVAAENHQDNVEKRSVQPTASSSANGSVFNASGPWSSSW